MRQKIQHQTIIRNLRRLFALAKGRGQRHCLLETVLVKHADESAIRLCGQRDSLQLCRQVGNNHSRLVLGALSQGLNEQGLGRVDRQHVCLRKLCDVGEDVIKR